MDQKLSRNTGNIQESATVSLGDKVRKLKAEGKYIVPLHTGDPDFATPAPITRAAMQAINDGHTHYSHSRGLPELREAISQELLETTGAFYRSEDEILITNGGIHACFTALTAILDEGDEVLVPTPIWTSHINVIKMAHGKPVIVGSTPGKRFIPSVEDLENAITAKTKAIIINSPNNPTGAVLSQEDVNGIIRLAEAHNLYIIADEVYNAILFDGHVHHSFAAAAASKDNIILVNSFSKTYAMTGWRIGYLAAPTEVIDQALKVSQFSITNVPAFTQIAALEALQNPEVKAQVDIMMKAYQKRADLVMQLAEHYKNPLVNITKPEGAFYFFVGTQELNWGDSIATANRLLDVYGIASVPGSSFGDCGEGYLRMTIAASDRHVEEGFRKLLESTPLL